MLQELEKPIHPQQKRQVVEAIHSLGLRVSPSQVAEKANLPVLVAGQELNRLATETGAHLEVTGSGAVVYAFDPRFEQAYVLAGPAKLVQRCGRILVNLFLTVMRALALAGIFILRISFGLLLICSVVALVVVAILALIALIRGVGGDGDSGYSGDSNGAGLDLGDLVSSGGDAFASQWSLSYWCFDWIWDWIFFPRYLWSPYYHYGGWWGGYSYYDDWWWGSNSYSPSNYNQPAVTDTIKDQSSTKDSGKPRTKFLDSTFALLFGSGDPNIRLEQRRWNEIATIIRLNQGVVVSEQLAPYVEGNKGDEDWMLPILRRFNGLPDVTETGHIIYLFPGFISSSADSEPQQQGRDATAPAQNADQLRALVSGHLSRQKVIKKSEAHKATLEPYLKEEEWQFLAEGGEFESVYLFVALAVALSCGLLYASSTVHFLHAFLPLFYGILGYCSIFFVFPLVRWVTNGYRNKAITERNDKRLEASAKLSSATNELRQKLDEARGVAMASLAEIDNRVVYTTEKDILEQQFER
jgi:hypothetical protein